ncbi:MAG TPA: vWA domain-containing protein [Vicinamibacterales bacterium]|nr:vWA domain-containing protein [Vicinamibacterales bacterium]
MQLFRDLIGVIEATWAEWGDLRLERLLYSEGSAARQVVLALVGVAAIFLVIRSFGSRHPGHSRMALPALVNSSGLSRAALARHGALLLALAGLPFFILALADPRTALTRSETTFPGRRIALLIDASSSMLSALPSTTLAKGAPNNAAFFTTVGAARYFIEQRMAGKYRDLMGLIEFGDSAYVITPFTTDYENILLSTSLIGDWNEFMAFPDQGTVVARAVEQAVGLFQAFDYLDAAGNLMVIFTDGADADVLENGKTVDDVLEEAQRAKIPVYLIKIGGNIQNKRSVADELWISAVKKTGGEFYSGGDEATIIKAIHAIDSRAAGTIEMKNYSTERPRYAAFAMTAALLWCAALVLRFTVPTFQTFP